MKKKILLVIVSLAMILTATAVVATPALACFVGTTVNITGPGGSVRAGTQVTLVISERNDSLPEYAGEGMIYNVWIDLQPGNVVLNSGTLYSGDTDVDGILDPGETWVWHYKVSVNADTLFTAIGHGWLENNPEWDITYGIYNGEGQMAYPGEKFELFVDTTGPGFGTKGYWHNKNGLNILKNDPNFSTLLAYINGLDPYKSPSDYFGNGDEPFNGYFTGGQPVAPAVKNLTQFGLVFNEISQFLVDPNATGGGADREQLAQQLLAFIFNVNYRLGSFSDTLTLPDGSSMTAQGIIDAAVAAWNSTGTADDVNWEHILDTINNNY